MNTEGNENATEARQLNLEQIVLERILDILRQATGINLRSERIGESVCEESIASWVKLPAAHSFSGKALVKAVLNARKEYGSFGVDVIRTSEREQPHLKITIRLKDGFEWRNAWEEAWSFVATPNPHCLSDNAVRLWRWARSPKNTGAPTETNRIGRQAQLKGGYRDVRGLFREIQVKAEPTMVIEGHRWREPLKVVFWDAPPRYYSAGPLNLPLRLSTEEVKHDELIRFRDGLYAAIQSQTFPKDNEILGVYDIRERRTAIACFSNWRIERFLDDGTSKFFHSVRLMPGLKLAWQFEDGPGPWLVICSLCEGWTWSRVKEWLHQQATEIPIEKKYGLGKDAAALLRWVLGLRQDECVGPFTPPVEDNLKVNIGIETNWDKENWGAYLGMIVEEINEKTEFDLRLQPWHKYSHTVTRIRLKQKSLEMDSLVRAIQLFAARQNKLLETERVESVLKELLT